MQKYQAGKVQKNLNAEALKHEKLSKLAEKRNEGAAAAENADMTDEGASAAAGQAAVALRAAVRGGLRGDGADHGGTEGSRAFSL